MKEIIEKVSPAALLEQTAEETAELGHACLKLARAIRGENPTPVPPSTLFHQLTEEAADVMLCLNLLAEAGHFSGEEIDRVMRFKQKRWKDRLNSNPPQNKIEIKW